jgi:type IV pilus assembly protein PilP
MIRLKKAALAVTTSLLVSGLTACGESNTEDLRSYVDQVKSRQAVRIEPLPEFAPYETYLYEASSDRDPFTAPVYSAPRSKIAQAGGDGISPDFNRAREPLETEPLDSLRMVGTLERNGNSWALVRMSDSTIHRVKPGNYLGQNHGKIISVTESELGVTEIVPDGLGGWMERQAALALSE